MEVDVHVPVDVRQPETRRGERPELRLDLALQLVAATGQGHREPGVAQASENGLLGKRPRRRDDPRDLARR